MVHWRLYWEHLKNRCDSGKCHLILSTDEPAYEWVQMGESLIKSANFEKLLSVKINSKLTFNKHIRTVCKEASNKLRTFSRVTRYMAIEKKRIIISSFCDSQFNCCPLVWMFQSRKNNTNI